MFAQKNRRITLTSWTWKPIESPNPSELTKLGELLRALTAENDSDLWPAEQLKLCGKAGVFRWFLPTEFGGYGWDSVAVTKGYLELAASCLTTTFVVTQRTAACKRIAVSDNEELRSRLLPLLATSESFATVGISHVTTSRRHLSKPVLRAKVHGDEYVVQGFTPWSTGAVAADFLVLGAELDDGRQIIFSIETNRDGVVVESGQRLVALTGSQTGKVICDSVKVSKQDVLSGPAENVLITVGKASSTGGLQTSTLALGLAQAAIDFIGQQSQVRSDLVASYETLGRQHAELKDTLLRAAGGASDCSKEEIRSEANSLVLRATQAALVAAKGAGFVKGHPVGRWCQEALFFLVWSCPQVVLDANLCELAGIAD